MRYQRAKAGFIRYADSELIVATGRILLAMKGSPVFTVPDPPLGLKPLLPITSRRFMQQQVAGTPTRLPSVKARNGWPTYYSGWPFT